MRLTNTHTRIIHTEKQDILCIVGAWEDRMHLVMIDMHGYLYKDWKEDIRFYQYSEEHLIEMKCVANSLRAKQDFNGDVYDVVIDEQGVHVRQFGHYGHAITLTQEDIKNKKHLELSRYLESVAIDFEDNKRVSK